MAAMKENLDALRRIDSGCIVDVFLKLGIDNYSITGLESFGKRTEKFVGVAHTAFMEKAPAEVKAYTRFDALEQCGEGDVLVTAGAGGRIVTGDMFVAYAAYKRLSGWVIDGMIRDAEGVDALDFCTCCEGVSNYLWRHGTKITALDVPVQVRGVSIKPGDVIMGDRDGILVIPGERVDEIIWEAEYVAQVEAEVPGIFASGEDIIAKLEDVDRRKAQRRPK